MNSTLIETAVVPPSRSFPWLPIVATAFAGYAVLCQLLRFRAEKATQRRFFQTNTPLADMTNEQAQQILETIIVWEFPFVYKLSLQFGIFKTYGVPAISRLLLATRALVDPAMAAKRYEDTAVLFAEFSLHPPRSRRCLQALARMNYLHGRHRGAIANDDFLYTLAATVVQPIRFIAQYESRPLNDVERCAMGVFWKSIGDAMNIDYAPLAPYTTKQDGLAFVDAITAWSRDYERRAVRPDPVNVKTSRRLVAMMLFFVPRWLQPFAVEMMTVVMGDVMRESFVYPEPGIVASAVVFSVLAVRRFVLRHLALPRWTPGAVMGEPDPVTGRIHTTTYLVEPWYIQPTLWQRWGPLALATRLLGGFVPTEESSAKPTKTWMPQGYLFSDIGPENRMGQGIEEGAVEEERLRRVRPSGCPFA